MALKQRRQLLSNFPQFVIVIYSLHIHSFAKKLSAKLDSRKWNMFDQSFEILMEILTPSGKSLTE